MNKKKKNAQATIEQQTSTYILNMDIPKKGDNLSLHWIRIKWQRLQNRTYII